MREEGAEALARRAGEAHVDCAVGQAFMAVALGDLPGEHRADGAVDVADRHLDRHLLAALERGLRELDQAVVERLLQAVRLAFSPIARHFRRHFRHREDAREVEAARLPVLDALAGIEQLAAADELVELPHAELRHEFAHFFGDEEEVVDHVLGLALELAPEHRVLRRHPDRAGIEMTFAHHDAAFNHQRRGGEAELVGPENRADDDVAAGFHLAVHLHRNAATQAVQHQRLLRLGEPQLPWRAGVLDRRPGRGTRAAVVAGDRHVVSLALGDAGGDGADAHFRDQLDRDRRLRVRVLQVVDQLRQILD